MQRFMIRQTKDFKACKYITIKWNSVWEVEWKYMFKEKKEHYKISDFEAWACLHIFSMENGCYQILVLYIFYWVNWKKKVAVLFLNVSFYTMSQITSFSNA